MPVSASSLWVWEIPGTTHLDLFHSGWWSKRMLCLSISVSMFTSKPSGVVVCKCLTPAFIYLALPLDAGSGCSSNDSPKWELWLLCPHILVWWGHTPRRQKHMFEVRLGRVLLSCVLWITLTKSGGGCGGSCLLSPMAVSQTGWCLESYVAD